MLRVLQKESFNLQVVVAKQGGHYSPIPNLHLVHHTGARLVCISTAKLFKPNSQENLQQFVDFVQQMWSLLSLNQSLHLAFAQGALWYPLCPSASTMHCQLGLSRTFALALFQTTRSSEAYLKTKPNPKQNNLKFKGSSQIWLSFSMKIRQTPTQTDVFPVFPC